MARDQVAELGTALARDQAFRQLADRHLDSSYRLALAILGNAAEAEDATHDAFVQAWRYWSTLRDHTRFEHWFDKILVNICRNRLKRASRWRSQDISDDIALARGDAYSEAVDRDAIAQAMRTLPPDQQVAIALRYFRDLTVAEIAERTGVPAGTVKTRLHYAVKRMHAALDAADVERTIS